MSLDRRNVLKGALAAGVAVSTKVPAAVAQPGPIKVGFLTVKSGALASGGLQMEQGMTVFFKQRNNMLAGRPVELQTADTGGNPAQARTKTQELVERFGVHVLIGPLAAFEALAIDDYIKSSKTPMLGGMTAFDEVAVRNMGDYALGSLSSCWYTAQLDNPINKRFVATYNKENGYDPGQYASGTYLYGEVLAAAIGALKGKIEDKNAFIKALRAVRVDTLRGPIAFDDYGNVVGNIYIRKVEKKDGRLVNTNIYTYPDVSQFWTYEPKEFLKQPVYSRDWPPMKAG